jgi:threonine/homoserine/homoserine lactone efflux protein
LQWLGAGFLAYLGVRYLVAKSNVSASLAIETNEQGDGLKGAREGFLIAVMNPTLPLFFLALFSQFVRETAPWQETVIITATAGGIDITWYIVVALVLSHTAVLDRLRRRAHIFDRVFGVILLGLAIHILI